MPTRATSSYHKENLEELLLRKAAQIVARRGLTALSLRELGRVAGVSRSAPYHYFADKADLLRRLGELGFARLGQSIAAALVPATSPQERLQAGLGAYLSFALEESDLFRLMFTNVLPRELVGTATAGGAPLTFSSPAAEAAFGGFVQAIAAAQSEGHLPPGDPLLLTHIFWAYVHGVAELALGQNLKTARDPQALLQAGVQALYRSLAAAAPGEPRRAVRARRAARGLRA